MKKWIYRKAMISSPTEGGEISIGKTRSPRRGTSPTSPGCHRSLDRGSSTGKKNEYIKGLLRNPLPDRRCRRHWSSSHRAPVPARPCPAALPWLRARPCWRWGYGRSAPARGEAWAGRGPPRGARPMLRSTCPHRGTPRPPQESRCGAAASLPAPVPAAPRGRSGGVAGSEGQWARTARAARGRGGAAAMLMSNGRLRPAGTARPGLSRAGQSAALCRDGAMAVGQSERREGGAWARRAM